MLPKSILDSFAKIKNINSTPINKILQNNLSVKDWDSFLTVLGFKYAYDVRLNNNSFICCVFLLNYKIKRFHLPLNEDEYGRPSIDKEQLGKMIDFLFLQLPPYQQSPFICKDPYSYSHSFLELRNAESFILKNKTATMIEIALDAFPIDNIRVKEIYDNCVTLFFDTMNMKNVVITIYESCSPIFLINENNFSIHLYHDLFSYLENEFDALYPGFSLIELCAEKDTLKLLLSKKLINLYIDTDEFKLTSTFNSEMKKLYAYQEILNA